MVVMRWLTKVAFGTCPPYPAQQHVHWYTALIWDFLVFTLPYCLFAAVF